jgi:hypothetical protein
MAKFESKSGKLYIDGKKVKIGFESFNGMYWFGTELDHTQDSVIGGKVIKNDKIWFGYVQSHFEEWGYFSQGELEAMGKYKVWKIPQKNLPISGRRN